MATEATLLDRLRMLERRVLYLERGPSPAPTRNFFIPATRGYVTNTSNPLQFVDERGFVCGDGVDTYVIGNWYMPADYSANLVITSIVICSGTTGKFYSATALRMGAAGEAYDHHTNNSGYAQTDSLTEQQSVNACTVSNAALGDYLTCVWHRDGNHGSDTATAQDCYCKGFMCSYTATR